MIIVRQPSHPGRTCPSRLPATAGGHCQRGFTLIEVLVAITLLAVGILAAATMQITALGGNSLANRVTTASTLAADTLESLMELPFDDPRLAATVPEAATATAADLGEALSDPETARSWEDELGQPAGFEVFWNVVEDYPLVDCKTIRVLVRRSDRGALRTIALDFVRMRPLSEL